jgi:site-specific DNA recombinase
MNLQEALSGGARAGDSECAEAIRDLVDTVTVFRDTSKPGGVQVEIVGRLTALLGEKAYPNGVKGVWGKMVAEDRSIHSPLPIFALKLRTSLP